jgi:hypothetical protein
MLADLPAEMVSDHNPASLVIEARSLLVLQWLFAVTTMFVCGALP